MPLYDYQCPVCHLIKPNVIQSVVAPAPKHCDTDMKRVLSAPSLRFLGGGFYVNDYAPAVPTETAIKPPKDL